MMLVMMFSTSQVQAAENVHVTENKVVQLEMVSMEKELGAGVNDINPKALLYNCLLVVNCSSSGMLLNFSTDCVQLAKTIGIKDVVIKQKVWYGWKTVATSVGGYYTNASTYTGSILYTNAIKGENYRITYTHYADADEYTEVNGELEFIFTY